MIKAVLFDLDGTLLNTLTDLADAANRMLKSQGYPEHPLDAYRFFVGSGMEKLVIRSLPVDVRTPDVITQCKAAFMDDYARNWMNATVLYPGIAELLDGLQKRALRVAILSNKPQAMTEKCVETYLNKWTFCPVVGQQEGIPVKPNPESALRIADEMDLPVDEILYVGDSNIDMLTATAAGMVSVGVAWGFRPKAELIEHGATYTIDHPDEMNALIAKLTQ